ncbi:hypothetical protein BLNAU_6323 [Blattamonas nauphoetae]|uniref:Uncharacterized protein n=1 Tax=Blattamonas nauphoetae TaxID=2049346 RepID=A0ABQ9Y548_9EUKA|nr:hypothetical protein BLNAU_6323 [Blattamonas nauphoetae]
MIADSTPKLQDPTLQAEYEQHCYARDYEFIGANRIYNETFDEFDFSANSYFRQTFHRLNLDPIDIFETETLSKLQMGATFPQSLDEPRIAFCQPQEETPISESIVPAQNAETENVESTQIDTADASFVSSEPKPPTDPKPKAEKKKSRGTREIESLKLDGILDSAFFDGPSGSSLLFSKDKGRDAKDSEVSRGLDPVDGVFYDHSLLLPSREENALKDEIEQLNNQIDQAREIISTIQNNLDSHAVWEKNLPPPFVATSDTFVSTVIAESVPLPSAFVRRLSTIQPSNTYKSWQEHNLVIAGLTQAEKKDEVFYEEVETIVEDRQKMNDMDISTMLIDHQIPQQDDGLESPSKMLAAKRTHTTYVKKDPQFNLPPKKKKTPRKQSKRPADFDDDLHSPPPKEKFEYYNPILPQKRFQSTPNSPTIPTQKDYLAEAEDYKPYSTRHSSRHVTYVHPNDQSNSDDVPHKKTRPYKKDKAKKKAKERLRLTTKEEPVMDQSQHLLPLPPPMHRSSPEEESDNDLFPEDDDEKPF